MGVARRENKLGETNISWLECIENPGEYLSQRAVLLPGANSTATKVYLRVRWIPESLYSKFTEFANLSSGDAKKQIEKSEKDTQKGVLKFGLIRGKNLGKSADVDPYGIIQFEGENKFELETKRKNNSQNPQWVEYFDHEVKFLKEGPKPPLVITVKDSNIFTDDTLGKVVVDLSAVFSAPNTWAINQYFNLRYFIY